MQAAGNRRNDLGVEKNRETVRSEEWFQVPCPPVNQLEGHNLQMASEPVLNLDFGEYFFPQTAFFAVAQLFRMDFTQAYVKGSLRRRLGKREKRILPVKIESRMHLSAEIADLNEFGFFYFLNALLRLGSRNAAGNAICSRAAIIAAWADSIG